MTWETNESQVLPLFAATDRHRNCVGSPIQFSTCGGALRGRLRGGRGAAMDRELPTRWSAGRDGGQRPGWCQAVDGKRAMAGIAAPQRCLLAFPDARDVGRDRARTPSTLLRRRAARSLGGRAPEFCDGFSCGCSESRVGDVAGE
jgi:hypothetical protein